MRFKEASERDVKGRAAADDLFAGALAAMTGDHLGAIPFLETVVSGDVPLPTS